MREKNGLAIIDYKDGNKRSSISISRAVVYLDAATREGGLDETIATIKTLAEKGKSSRDVVTGICLGLDKRLSRFMRVFEQKTGERALPYLDNRNEIAALAGYIHELAQESDGRM